MDATDPRHGTYAGSAAHYKAGGKPCPPCREARRTYHTRYTKERQLGYVRRIPANHGEVWQRLDDLYQSGYSYARLATAIGNMRESRLYTIHRGGPNGAISVKTWKILNGRLSHVKPPPTRTGTLRRLQALHALGWPVKHVMDMTGHTPEIGKRALRGEHVNFSHGTMWSIAEVYDRLNMTLPPTEAPAGVKAAIVRAQRRSAAMGWHPPLAWEDIDTRPTPVARLKRRRRLADQLSTKPSCCASSVESRNPASSPAPRSAKWCGSSSPRESRPPGSSAISASRPNATTAWAPPHDALQRPHPTLRLHLQRRPRLRQKPMPRQPTRRRVTAHRSLPPLLERRMQEAPRPDPRRIRLYPWPHWHLGWPPRDRWRHCRVRPCPSSRQGHPMTACNDRHTTQPGNRHWTCIRPAGHLNGHGYAKEPAPDDEPHPNTDWQELTP